MEIQNIDVSKCRILLHHWIEDLERGAKPGDRQENCNKEILHAADDVLEDTSWNN
jgi:hypothetical protein